MGGPGTSGLRAGDDPVNVLYHSYEYFFSIHYRPTTRFTFYSILQKIPGFTAYLKKYIETEYFMIKEQTTRWTAIKQISWLENTQEWELCLSKRKVIWKFCRVMSKGAK